MAGDPTSAGDARDGAGVRAAAELAAQAEALRQAGAIRQLVEPMLRALCGVDSGKIVAALRPRPGDYARVFVPAAVEPARAGYEALWARPDALFEAPLPAQSTLRIGVAPAGMLGAGGAGPALARDFPVGYAAVAPLLDPHRTWICWKYTRPQQASGLAYDGLVWCDDHFIWLPRPYRVLAACAAALRDSA